MGVRLGELVNLHLLHSMLVVLANPSAKTYHLEGVELFLDLLCEHRSQPVARSNLSTSVVIGRRPRIVELDARAKADSNGPLRCAWQASGAGVR